MGTGKRDKKRIILITLILATIMLVAASIRIYDELFASNIRTEASAKYLYCYSDVTPELQMEKIRAQEVIKHPDALFRILKLSGYDKMIKPGRYKLNPDLSNIDLIRLLVSGRQETFNLVFKQADKLNDAISFFGRNLECDSNELEQMLFKPSLLDSFGLDSNSAIMLFIPDTYNFYWNTSAKNVLDKMIKAYQNFWNDKRISKVNALGLNKKQVGILASIVQKETYRKDEMPLIAGVYVNRMKYNMPLQADPTILYILNNPEIHRVSGEMLKVESPYNTYINKGLPPGPICMPNQISIDAVLNMQQHKYLYFCAREDFSGYHAFAESFSQHMKNASRYQRALNKKGIK